MAEEELRELADINLSHQYGGGRWGSGDHYGGGTGDWSRSPGGGGSLSHQRATPVQGHGMRAAEAEDIMGRRGGSLGPRGRSGLYYSPPGTSYTIVERPPPRGTYLGPSSTATPNNSHHQAPQQHHHPPTHHPQRTPAGKKRPISPEQVLKLFGGHTDNDAPVEKPHRPSPGPRVDPRSLPVRTVNMSRGPPGSDQSHGFGICVKGGTKDSGEYKFV